MTKQYSVDEETQNLIEVALNCMLQLSSAQVDDDAAENLELLADELAKRFGIRPVELEEQQHGDEIIYKPRGGVFRDDDEADH